MKTLFTHRRLWFHRCLSLLVTAVLVHLLAVWAVPRLIMGVVMQSSEAKAMNMHNQAAFPPRVTAKSRSIMLPSPDLLYSMCVFDMRQGPVRITAHPKLQSYWSIALYAANSDNFFVVNDRSAGAKPVDLWLVSQQGSAAQQAVPVGSQVIVTPTQTGLLLMRVLIGDYDTEKAVVEPARRTLACTPI